MTKILTLYISLLILIPSMTYCQGNPLLSPNKTSQKDKHSSENNDQNKSQTPHWLTPVMARLSGVQRALHKTLSEFIRNVKDKPSPGLYFLVMGIAFTYGIAHALGPGHGKILIMSFFLSERPLLLKGLIMGNMFAFLHTGSAVLLVLVMRYIIQKTSIVAADQMARTIMMISYGLLTVIGMVLFVKKIRLGNHTHTQVHSVHSHSHYYSRGIISMAIALGVVPCPGTTLLLLFCLSIGVLPFGIMLVLAMGAGMAVTISAVGLITIVLKKQVLSTLSKNERIARIVTRIIELTGAFALFLAGLVLLISSLP